MRRISFLVNTSLAERLFLKTPLFGLLKEDANNHIRFFTTSARQFKKNNVAVSSIAKWFFLNKLGLRREKLIPLFYRLEGVFDSDIIIFAEWSTPESYAILQEAKKRNIVTLFVQEGSINPTVSYPVDTYPDKLAVWGQIARNLYIKRGIEPSRIAITGQPRFDWHHRFRRGSAFGADNKPKKLLFASQALWKEPQVYPEANKIIEETITIVHRAAQELGLKFSCKLHPSDKKELYEREGIEILPDTGVSPEKCSKWFCATGYNPAVTDLKNLTELLCSFDIVVTILSTVGLEAIALGKPVIFLDMAGYHRKSELNTALRKEADFAFVDNEQDFKDLLRFYMAHPTAHQPRAEELLEKVIFKNDGNASQRVVDLINQMV